MKNKTTVSHLKNKNDQLIGIDVRTNDDHFVIPVADVRRNRKQVDQIEKAANISRGSKYFKPSFSLMGYSYNLSLK